MFLSVLRRKTPISMQITLYGEIMALRETCIMRVFEIVRYQNGKKKNAYIALHMEKQSNITKHVYFKF